MLELTKNWNNSKWQTAVTLAGGCAWVRLVCGVSVACLSSWCPVCQLGHVPVGYDLLSPCGVRSLCFPGSVSARAWAVGQAVLWHVYCEHHYAL